MPESVRVLRPRRPVAAEPLRRFLHAHTLPGAERHEITTGTHSRVVPTTAGPVVVHVDLGTAAVTRSVRVRWDAPADGPPTGGTPAGLTPTERTPADRTPEDRVVDEVLAVVRRWLDLDADTDVPEEALSRDPVLGPLVTARPGLRVPRTVAGAETALLTVLGQQVSLAAARTFGGRLVAAYGTPVSQGFTAFPDPAVLAAAGPEALRAATGVTGARSRCLHSVATALADGLDLDAVAGDPVATAAAYAELLALPGIGPWTADYVALRVFEDSDAFLSSDLVLRRALGGVPAREALLAAQAWRPWRGYALLHLWTAEVFR